MISTLYYFNIIQIIYRKGKNMRKKYIHFWSIELLIMVALIVIYKLTENTSLSKCLINEKYNIQCPSCGGTRCFINFINMNFNEAFQNNMVFFFTIIYIIILNIIFVINFITQKRRFKWFYPTPIKCVVFSIVLVFFGIFRNFL